MREAIQAAEKEVLGFWRNNNTFQKSIERRKKSPKFVFYEGPPTANAKPGLHHILVRTFKDAVCRYKTMRGFFVPRKAGWDTHGLPVELQIEKKLGLKSKKDIEDHGIAKFNEECRKSVWEYVQDWRSLTEKIGFWIDLDNPYITYTPEYMETLWFILSTIWKKGLLYKDFKVVPWCTRCGTALSSHEVAQGYENITEEAVYIKFKAEMQNAKFKITSQNSKVDAFLLSWTTTPWTLPGNVALAVNPKIKYVLARLEKENYILAKSRVKEVLGKEARVLKEFSGKELAGSSYKPLFRIPSLQDEKSHKVYLADFVTEKEGTGIVHTAVMYGADDFELGAKISLPKHHTVDRQGRFTAEVDGFLKKYVKDPKTQDLILAYLKKRGLLFGQEKYSHDYPFCWRCKTPLLYYASDSWFIKTSNIKKELILNNKKINWIPGHIKEGRFGEWLGEVKDWALSRERYWGTPLPIWQCQMIDNQNPCDNLVVIGSLEDLRKQKFTTNDYYLMRHGQTIYQTEKKEKVYPSPDSDDAYLTKRGMEQVRKTAQKLKKEGLEIIFSSDLIRAKETARIVSEELGLKVVYDKRLRDLDFGRYHSGSKKEYLKAYPLEEIPLQEKIPGGESFLDCGQRAISFFKEINKRYYGKKILIVSHGYPLWFMEEASRNGNFRGYKEEKFGLAETRKLNYELLPFNGQGQLDLHRPYVDEVEFLCPKCQSFMRRVSDVVDVWFDSGAMPFAQVSWPQARSKVKDQKSRIKSYRPPELFPADYICEAQDQTRGWFYTLHAISALLGFGPAFKNAIVTGLLLDEKGEKMSKSKGNIVNPWLMLEKYGADAVRWYFLTVNRPGDPKLFSEKDIKNRSNKFVMTFWNSFIFFKTYSARVQNSTFKVKNLTLLDRWIFSQLNKLIKEVTADFDNFDLTSGCRKIEAFVIDDLSNWHIRRSRKRFQRPDSKKELKRASQVLGYVLLEVCKLTAPFTPFISEKIFKELSKGSVHLQDWPQARSKFIDKILEQKMAWAREITALALQKRAEAGIKVRQPLLKLKVKSEKQKIDREFHELLELIKEEVNVKEIELAAGLKEPIKLETIITPELKAEGELRELVRQIQEIRKNQGFLPKDKVVLFIQAPDQLKSLIEKYQGYLIKETNAQKITFPTEKLPSAKELSFDRHPLQIYLKRANV